MRAAALLAWRNLSSRPLRTALTAGGVVLGVALVLSVLITARSMDAELRAVSTGDAGDAPITVIPDRGASWLDRNLETIIGQGPGVALVIPQVMRGSIGLAMNGEIVSVPFFAVDPTVEGDLNTYKLVDGHFPDKNQEEGIVLERTWAAEHGLAVGDPVSVLVNPKLRLQWRVSGLMAREGIGRRNGGAVVLVDLAQYQAATEHLGQVSRFLVTLAPGAKASHVLAELERTLPEGALALETSASTGAGNSVRTGLGFFAGIATLVGAFLIFGAFSHSLRQRIVQTGVIRAVGATSGQVAASLLLEAAGVGLAGGLLSLPVGAALSLGMIKLVGAAQGGRTIASLDASPLDFVFSLTVGLAVAVAAALLPAWRASRLSPVEAIRNVPAAVARQRIALTLGGLAMAVVGVTSWTWTIRSGNVLLGQAFIFVYYLGVATLSGPP